MMRRRSNRPRYRNDPTILAWDLRNEGTWIRARSGIRALQPDEVLGWLAHISQLVQENDPYHLRTAGWWAIPR
jgi:endo-1,4-beta-mannosidase